MSKLLKPLFLLLATAACALTALSSADAVETKMPAASKIANKKEQTLSIIKPDAVAGNHIGDIIARFENNGLRVVAIKMVQLDRKQADEFYAVHRKRPFFPSLVEFMSSSPVVIMVLEGDNAVAKNREIMGATNPKDAAKGTLRADFAKSVGENAVHGSDSLENAKEEINYFFKPEEVLSH